MTSNTSRDKILQETEQGFLFFLKFFPSLIITKRYGLSIELDSPLPGRPGKLSVYFNDERGKWFFCVEGANRVYGDIFMFVATLYGLDFKRHFPQIVKIIQREMHGFDPGIMEQRLKIMLGKGEWVEVETALDSGNAFQSYFIKDADVSITLKAVSGYKMTNSRAAITSTEEKQYFSVEAIENKLYYVFDTASFKCHIVGKRPDNYFFGFEQAIKINFFLNPCSKPNLLMCDSATDVMIFNFLGIPAIHVDKQVTKSAYFQHIIAPTFSNLISVNGGWLPKPFLNNYSVKTFELNNCLGDLDLRAYTHMQYGEDDFLEPLWELYEHINDDKLLENES